jgi:hypothetical protein
MGSDDDERRARAHGNRLGRLGGMAGVGCGCPSRASAARRTLYGTAPHGAGRTGGWAGHCSAERLTHTHDVPPTAQPVGSDYRPGPVPRGRRCRWTLPTHPRPSRAALAATRRSALRVAGRRRPTRQTNLGAELPTRRGLEPRRLLRVGTAMFSAARVRTVAR